VGRQSVIVLDTHALIWWVGGSSELSPKARRAVQTAARRRELVASSISIFEIATAVRCGRLELSVPLDTWLDALGHLPELTIYPVTEEIARLAGSLDEKLPGDPADRLIASTALTLDCPLVTADAILRAADRLQAIW
jgi:PIN domain nuclease of toxin-antitoxin system